MVKLKKLIDLILVESIKPNANDQIKDLAKKTLLMLKERKEIRDFYILLSKAYNSITEAPEVYLSELKETMNTLNLKEKIKEIHLLNEIEGIELNKIDEAFEMFLFEKTNRKNLDDKVSAKRVLIEHIKKNREQKDNADKLKMLAEKYDQLTDSQKTLLEAVVKNNETALKEELNKTLRNMDVLMSEEDDLEVNNKVLAIKNRLLETYSLNDDKYKLIEVLNNINIELNV